MADRPILFSAPMVRALLEGHKTQTRRIIKPQPDSSVTSVGVLSCSGVWSWLSGDPRDIDTWAFEGEFHVGYRPGDRLWVKETWHAESWYDRHSPKRRAELVEQLGAPHVWYPAGYLLETPYQRRVTQVCALDLDAQWSKGQKRVSIHMPRWASRITLTVTDVRVERLQDISKGDAISEGIEWLGEALWRNYAYPSNLRGTSSAVVSYKTLWDSINGSGAWDSNPWVVAVSFDVRRGNIDG